MKSSSTRQEILASREFREMAQKKNTVAIILTAAELVIYFGFIFLIAFHKPFLAKDMAGSITVGLPLGLGVIVASWLLTGLYVRWANDSYDSMVKKVKESIGG